MSLGRLYANPGSLRGKGGPWIQVACLEMKTSCCLSLEPVGVTYICLYCEPSELSITEDCGIPYDTENPFKRVKRVGHPDEKSQFELVQI